MVYVGDGERSATVCFLLSAVTPTVQASNANGFLVYLRQHQSHDAEQPRYANTSQAIEHRVLVVLAQSVWPVTPEGGRMSRGPGITSKVGA